MTLKFSNPTRMRKVWGQAEPPELRKIIEYLCDEEKFEPPSNWKHCYTLDLKKKINDQLTIVAGFNTTSEFPKNVFNFGSSITLYSKYIEDIANKLKLYTNSSFVIDDLKVGTAIFCVYLSHLKWNATETNINPTYSVSTIELYDNQAETWIADWKSYASPIILNLQNLNDAIYYCEYIKSYSRQPWVKSSGYLSSDLNTFRAILYVQNKQFRQAIEALEAVIQDLNPLRKAYFEKLRNWVYLESVKTDF
jgi:hypothetical protein